MIIGIGIGVAVAASLQVGTRQVDFDSEVRPILSDQCFACHGHDEDSRQAGLRLDTRAGLLADLGGYAAVVPGDLAASELWLRVTAEDELERMPPPRSHKPALSGDDLEILKAWILGGASWTRHWAFLPPLKEELKDSASHPIRVSATSVSSAVRTWGAVRSSVRSALAAS